MMKQCCSCQQLKDPSDFNQRNGKPIGRCKECRSEYFADRHKRQYNSPKREELLTKSRAWSKANRNPRRITADERIQKTYGVPSGYKQQLIEQQKDCCAICANSLDHSKPHNVVLDHCHSTGTIRGVLCRSCNWLLGFARDDPATLRKAAEYLDESKSGTHSRGSG